MVWRRREMEFLLIPWLVSQELLTLNVIETEPLRSESPKLVGVSSRYWKTVPEGSGRAAGLEGSFSTWSFALNTCLLVENCISVAPISSLRIDIVWDSWGAIIPQIVVDLGFGGGGGEPPPSSSAGGASSLVAVAATVMVVEFEARFPAASLA